MLSLTIVRFSSRRLLLAWRLPSAQTGQPASADSVARDLQAKCDRITDFSADFIHSYRAAFQTAGHRVGHLLVKRKMRWEYTSPEKKTFVPTAQALFYIPRTNRWWSPPCRPTIRRPRGAEPRARAASRAIPRGVRQSARGARGRHCPPTDTQKPEPDYNSLTLVVQPGSLNLSLLVTVDPRGPLVFTFTNLKENVGLTDNQFVFKIPRGVDVVTDGAK
jgi:outer membrane lipoprotein-sorting protein